MPLSFAVPERFASADEEAWWASVDKALKGMSRERLFETTEDGFKSAPLFDGRKDLSARAARPAGADWSIIQRIDIPDPAEANAQILEDLEGGASGLELVFSNQDRPDLPGIRVDTVESVATLLKDVQLELIDLRLSVGGRQTEPFALLLGYLKQQGIDPANLNLSIDLDPCGWSALSNCNDETIEALRADCQDIAETVSASAAHARLLHANGNVWHDAGATPAQELAYLLASAVEYLRLLEGTSLAPETWAQKISVTLVADADQISTIAKARAFRSLWSSVLDGAGLPQVAVTLHMSTSFRMQTRRDPWVNLLRNTVAVFAAGTGGVDSITVLPHTQAIGLPDAFARRLARNTQSILLEESGLAKVVDPAAGSGAIEDRTEKLCTTAWALFQEIEAAGGMASALKQGLVQSRIADAVSDRKSRVAKRKQPITGVSEFPQLAQDDVSVLEAPDDGLVSTPNVALELPQPGNGQRFAAMCDAATAGKPLLVLAPAPGAEPVEGGAVSLSQMRVSEPFEDLRRQADLFESKTGKPARVFLASLGSLAQFTARATWSANAFAAGGIEAVGTAVYESLDDLLEAFKGSDAPIACIVSSDAVYETQAEDAARALKAAGVRQLYLAGKPGNAEQNYSSTGVDSYLYAGCDLLALLEQTHAELQAIHGVDLSEKEVLK